MKVFAADSMLRDLHRISDGRYTRVDDPADADIVLLMVRDGVSEWSCVAEYQAKNFTAGNFESKTFVVCTGDLPQYTYQGVYTSAAGALPRFGSRVRSGAYNLISDQYKNPFVRDAEPGIGLRTPKKYLFSFIGRDCSSARTTLLRMRYRRSDILIKDSSDFDLWRSSPFGGSGNSAGREFFDALTSSKFALCPAGNSPNSIRLFECMKLGVAPVVISDGWLRPVGPDWDQFCIFVKESELGRLEDIVEAHESRHIEMGQAALRAHENFFADNAYFNFLVDSCADILNRRWLPEKLGSRAIRTWRRGSEKVVEARKLAGLRTRLRRMLTRSTAAGK